MCVRIAGEETGPWERTRAETVLSVIFMPQPRSAMMFKILAFTAAMSVSALLAFDVGAAPVSTAKLGLETGMMTPVRDDCGRGRRWSNSRQRCVRTSESRENCERGFVWSNSRGRCMRDR